MNRDEALALLKGGEDGIVEWNGRRRTGEDIPPLELADLSEANLRGANLNGADLSEAKLREAILFNADLSDANLSGADLFAANLSEAKLSEAQCGDTIFAKVDLSSVKGLETVRQRGPSTVGVDTLYRSGGQIPEVFLRGCGLSPWEIEISRLYDSALNAREIEDLLVTKVFQARTEGPLYIGGVFISYSHVDAKFVDKMYKQLYDKGASVWIDRHDAPAGPLKEIVGRAGGH